MWSSPSNQGGNKLNHLEKEVIDLQQNVKDVNQNLARKPNEDHSKAINELQKRYKELNEKLENECASDRNNNLYDQVEEELRSLRKDINKAIEAQAEIFKKLKDQSEKLKRDARDFEYEHVAEDRRFRLYDGANVPLARTRIRATKKRTPSPPEPDDRDPTENDVDELDRNVSSLKQKVDSLGQGFSYSSSNTNSISNIRTQLVNCTTKLTLYLACFDGYNPKSKQYKKLQGISSQLEKIRSEFNKYT